MRVPFWYRTSRGECSTESSRMADIDSGGISNQRRSVGTENATGISWTRAFVPGSRNSAETVESFLGANRDIRRKPIPSTRSIVTMIFPRDRPRLQLTPIQFSIFQHRYSPSGQIRAMQGVCHPKQSFAAQPSYQQGTAACELFDSGVNECHARRIKIDARTIFSLFISCSPMLFSVNVDPDLSHDQYNY